MIDMMEEKFRHFRVFPLKGQIQDGRHCMKWNITYTTVKDRKINVVYVLIAFGMLNTIFIYLCLCDFGHLVKATQIMREETCCHHFMGYTFQLAARYLLYGPSHKTG